MGKTNKTALSNVKVILWFILIIEVLIFLLAIIFGSLCGFKDSFIAHGVLGLIIGGCLLLLLITGFIFNAILTKIENLMLKDK